MAGPRDPFRDAGSQGAASHRPGTRAAPEPGSASGAGSCSKRKNTAPRKSSRSVAPGRGASSAFPRLGLRPGAPSCCGNPLPARCTPRCGLRQGAVPEHVEGQAERARTAPPRFPPRPGRGVPPSSLRDTTRSRPGISRGGDPLAALGRGPLLRIWAALTPPPTPAAHSSLPWVPGGPHSLPSAPMGRGHRRPESGGACSLDWLPGRPGVGHGGPWHAGGTAQGTAGPTAQPQPTRHAPPRRPLGPRRERARGSGTTTLCSTETGAAALAPMDRPARLRPAPRPPGQRVPRPTSCSPPSSSPSSALPGAASQRRSGLLPPARGSWGGG